MAKKTAITTDGIQKYIAYYRVSTVGQGKSGLGLESQRDSVRGFVRDSPIVAEFTEVESGKKNQREQLVLAIAAAKKNDAVLIIAKLDRLSRNAAFIFTLRDSGVNFLCVDMPDANTLTIGIFATLAQHERELISSRTKSALAVKQQQGAVLGKPENLTSEAQAKGVASIKRKAADNQNNRRASAMVAHLRSQGKTFAEIAKQLNRDGFVTSTGKEFHAMQAQRLHKRSTSGDTL
ncbi:recombinase family protein [Larkinella punicea]|uniref:Resolvase n=1 Tax=Larkinella punicea TaxID=2315727 RepID=A0A368JL70_9BACT|nr:recombinase family protein [Larkinella punicea]RCR68282.1 resolvase [Larkinella punicea]